MGATATSSTPCPSKQTNKQLAQRAAGQTTEQQRQGPGARAIYGSRIMPLHQPSAPRKQATFYMRFRQPSSTKTTSATPDSIGMLKYGDAPRCLDGTKANRARIKNKDETRDFLW